jgi:hypothetical protein
MPGALIITVSRLDFSNPHAPHGSVCCGSDGVGETGSANFISVALFYLCLPLAGGIACHVQKTGINWR